MKIKIEELTKTFGEIRAVDNIDILCIPVEEVLPMHWYLSVEGQYLLASLRGQYSLRPDVPPIPHIPPLNEINYWVPNPELLLDENLRDSWIQDANSVWGWQ